MAVPTSRRGSNICSLLCKGNAASYVASLDNVSIKLGRAVSGFVIGVAINARLSNTRVRDIILASVRAEACLGLVGNLCRKSLRVPTGVGVVEGRSNGAFRTVVLTRAPCSVNLRVALSKNGGFFCGRKVPAFRRNVVRALGVEVNGSGMRLTRNNVGINR